MAQQQKTVKVKLLKPHTHNHVPYEAGDTIEDVGEHDARWMRDNKVGEPTTALTELKQEG